MTPHIFVPGKVQSIVTDNDLLRGWRNGADFSRLAAIAKKWREACAAVADHPLWRRWRLHEPDLFVVSVLGLPMQRDPGAHFLITKVVVDALAGGPAPGGGDHRISVLSLAAAKWTYAEVPRGFMGFAVAADRIEAGQESTLYAPPGALLP